MITLFSSVKRLLSFRAVVFLISVLTASTMFATNYVTDVMLIGGSKSTTNTLKSAYGAQGWIVVDQDLNAKAGGDYIYLLYRTDSSNGINCGYVTDFYITNAARPVPETLTSGGRTYHLVPYVGDTHFVSTQGDLNSNTNGADIHLYYTKDVYQNSAVTSIFFNASSGGGVGLNGTSGGYDLNKGCGASSDYIYMHLNRDFAEIPSLPGSGTSSDPFIINNSTSWAIFAANVNHGINTDKYYKVSDSYSDQTSTSKMIGTTDYPFKGTFDGNGKTISFNIDAACEGAAPFRVIDGATIKNFDAFGSVHGFGNHTAGLVGLCSGEGTHTIKDCTVRMSVLGTTYLGGIIGHGGHGTLTVENCTFTSVVGNFQKFAGGIVGWCDDVNLTIKNCFFNGYLDESGGKQHPIALKNAASTVNANITGTYYLNKAFPSIDLGGNAIPGINATPVSSTLVEGDWADEITIQDQTYYKLSTPKEYPYEYGFEMGLCDWTLVNGHANTAFVTGDRRSGQYSFSFAQSDQDQILISPQLRPISKLEFECYVKGVSGEYNMQLGVSNTTNDISAFQWSPFILSNSSWTQRLSGTIAGGVKYIAIKYVAGSGAFRVDDFKVTDPFPYPKNLRVNEITSNSVTFEWDCPSEDVLGYFWKIRRADSENVWFDSNSIDSASETSVTITGLAPGTDYVFYLEALYSGANTSTWATAEFNTAVQKVQLPYNYGFEDGMSLWEIINGEDGTGVSSELAYEGSNSILFKKSDLQYQFLVSPMFEEYQTIKGSFYARAADYSHPTTFYYGTIGADASSLNWITGYTIRGSVWQEFDFVMPQGARRFVVAWINDDDGDNDLYLDDFKFYEALSLTFPKEGYLTYYDSQHSLVLPKGMKARIVIGIDADGVPIYHTVADGYVWSDESSLAETGVSSNTVLPRTSVVLQVAPSDEEQTFVIDLAASNVSAPLLYDNYLRGSDEATTTTLGDYFYKLGYNDDDNYGWVFGAENGGPFTTQPHEAWLGLWSRMTMGRDYFSLFNFDQPTGIKKIDNSQQTTDDRIYNLSGQRLERQQKGINIISGKKILVK